MFTMTSYMSLTIPNPFSEWAQRRPYIFSEHPYSTSQDDLPSLPHPIRTPPRRKDALPSPYLPTRASVTRNDENKRISSSPERSPARAREGSVSLQLSPRQRVISAPVHPRHLLSEAFQQTVAALAADNTSEVPSVHDSETESRDDQNSVDLASGRASVSNDIENDELGSERAHNLNITLSALEGAAGHTDPDIGQPKCQTDVSSSQFKRWADSLRRKRPNRDGSTFVRPSLDIEMSLHGRPRSSRSYTLPPTNIGRFTHSSNNSSAFVETVKTASMSAASLSVSGRSIRTSHMSNHGAHRNSRLSTSAARFSADSDRPSSAPSLDEATPLRAQKRRQILNELLSSERSYVSDLKALANVSGSGPSLYLP